MDEGSLKGVNFFSGDITDQCNFELTRLIIHGGFKIIVNKYQTYNMMRLINNMRCTFPTMDAHGHLE